MDPDTFRLRTQIAAAIRNRKNRPLTANAKLHDGRRLLIASYNVHKCVGTDGRFDPGRIAQVIKEIDPDIIALQEADKRFGERVGLLDLGHLEREVGLSWVGTIGATRAHGWHGNVVLFRRGVVRDVHQVTLPGLEPRGALVVDLDLEDGAALRIVAAHLGLLRRSRSQQARRLIEIMQSREERPTLLLGDLNEWRLGERSSLNELVPAFHTLPVPVPSFPSGLPLLALDRIIANRPEILSDVEVHDTPLARTASDHLPIKAYVDPSLPALSLPAAQDTDAAIHHAAGQGGLSERPLPLPAAGPEQRNGELVRQAGARLKRAVSRTLGRRQSGPRS